MTPRVTATAALVALVAFATIAGAQQSPSPARGAASKVVCNGGTCKADVSVSGDCANPANISVVPDPLPVGPKKTPNRIEWTIVTDGYKWVSPPNGITFTKPQPNTTNPFSDPHVTGNGKKYALKDDNKDDAPTDYPYDIRLLRDDGTACAVKDPIIRNGS